MKLSKNLNEKKENADMRNEMDLLVDSLIQKQASIFNKIQLVDEKAAVYKITEQGEVIQNLIEAFDEVENQIDDSLESFDRVEDSVVQAWEQAWDRIKEQALEAWAKMQEDCEELVAVNDESEEIEPLPNETLSDIGRAIKHGYKNAREIPIKPSERLKEEHNFDEVASALVIGEYTIKRSVKDSDYCSDCGIYSERNEFDLVLENGCEITIKYENFSDE